MPKRNKSVAQHGGNRPKDPQEKSLLERAEYFDKWRALKDDLQQTHGSILPPTTDEERMQAVVLQTIIERMDEYEDGTR